MKKSLKTESNLLNLLDIISYMNYKYTAFGTMKMVLTVCPAFNEKNERHVRFVEEKESPYYKK